MTTLPVPVTQPPTHPLNPSLPHPALGPHLHAASGPIPAGLGPILTRIPAILEAKIISASASGLTTREVSKALGVSQATVSRTLKRGDTWDVVRRLREQVRVTVAESLASIQPLALTRVHKALSDPASNAKDIDALSRAALNLEKVGASVSGENHKPTGPGTVEVHIVLPLWTQPQNVLPPPVVIDVTPLDPDLVEPQKDLPTK